MVAFNPITIRVKIIAIEMGLPTFIKVALMPEPAPRCLGGRLFMMAAVLGAINMPIDRPSRKMMAANNGYLKLTGRSNSRKKPTAVKIMAIVAK